jgi:YHS domain-containing protein
MQYGRRPRADDMDVLLPVHNQLRTPDEKILFVPSALFPHLYLGGAPDGEIPIGEDIMATDPVCFMIVDEDTAQFRSAYRDTEYYFCCNYCKKQFDENPKRYSRLANDMTVDLGSGC